MPPPHRQSNPASSSTSMRIAKGALILGALMSILLGLVMAGGGTWLVTLGGTWYYLLAGLGFTIAGLLHWMPTPGNHAPDSETMEQ